MRVLRKLDVVLFARLVARALDNCDGLIRVALLRFFDRTRANDVVMNGYKSMKRIFDLVVAALGLLVLAVPLLVLMLLVRIKLGKPVFFFHQRPGQHGRPFYVVKLRTMTNERGPDGELLSDARRLTPFGYFLRLTSLDELPELWNVLKGEMSLVGPRPLEVEYLPLYSPAQMRRHDVRPGITGWAQINGRNAITWTRRFELDLWYVDNRSFLLDLKILCLTIIRVLQRTDVMPEGEGDDTLESFNGSN